MSMPLSEAVEKYNALRKPGNDHGIIGAYRELVRVHGRENLPTHEAIMAARSKRVLTYEHTLDHRFTPEQQEQYDSLKAAGRTEYDELRWYRGYSHELAFERALEAHGLKRTLA